MRNDVLVATAPSSPLTLYNTLYRKRSAGTLHLIVPVAFADGKVDDRLDIFH
jgi:hypothetical protein